MTVVSECELLRPVPSKAHSDDWPIHHLEKVDVISLRTHQSVSLLESHTDHAVQVTGTLEAIDPMLDQKGM